MRRILEHVRARARTRPAAREAIRGRRGNVIIVPSPDERYFKEAIFLLSDDLFTRPGVSPSAILREARSAAEDAVCAVAPPQRRSMGPYALGFVLGAAAASVLFLLL